MAFLRLFRRRDRDNALIYCPSDFRRGCALTEDCTFASGIVIHQAREKIVEYEIGPELPRINGGNKAASAALTNRIVRLTLGMNSQA